jgi:molybdenum cofactor biosynthesis enzyme MoaA
VFVELSDQGDLDIMPCCTYQLDALGASILNHNGKKVSSLTEYFSSSKLQELKEHFIANEGFPEVGCGSCKFKEDNGLISYRNLYRVNSEEHEFKDGIQYIELMLDRQCNMACFMCRPESSTTLAHEYKSLGWIEEIPRGNVYSILPELNNLPNNIQLNVVGGEPFMSKYFDKLLEVAIAKEWTVSILTNASLVNKKILALLDQVKEIKFTVSLDGIGDELYALMRWPGNWDTFLRNFDMLKNIVERKHGLNKMIKEEPTNLQKLHINYAVQVLNVGDVYNMISWAKDQKAYIRLSAVLQERPWVGFAILNTVERQNLISWLKTILNKNIFLYQKKEILGWIKYLETSKTNLILREEFLNKISKILKHRNIDITAATKNLFYAEELASQLKDRYDSL